MGSDLHWKYHEIRPITCVNWVFRLHLTWYLGLKVSDEMAGTLSAGATAFSKAGLDLGSFQGHSHGWEPSVSHHTDLSMQWLHQMAPDFSREEGTRKGGGSEGEREPGAEESLLGREGVFPFSFVVRGENI